MESLCNLPAEASTRLNVLLATRTFSRSKRPKFCQDPSTQVSAHIPSLLDVRSRVRLDQVGGMYVSPTHLLRRQHIEQIVRVHPLTNNVLTKGTGRLRGE